MYSKTAATGPLLIDRVLKSYSSDYIIDADLLMAACQVLYSTNTNHCFLQFLVRFERVQHTRLWNAIVTSSTNESRLHSLMEKLTKNIECNDYLHVNGSQYLALYIGFSTSTTHHSTTNLTLQNNSLSRLPSPFVSPLHKQTARLLSLWPISCLYVVCLWVTNNLQII